jgi:Ca-activated chloride channel homolog
MRHFLARALLALVGLSSVTSAALAQGLLVSTNAHDHYRLPRPIVPSHPIPATPTYKIKEIDVHARLVDQAASVQVSQTFANTGSMPLEVSFLFPLPYDGAIDQLTLLVDGQEYPARLLSKEEARQVYESIVRKNRDPALLEWMGSGMFQTSVFPVPPGAERKVTLHYTQLCRRDQGLIDFLFPLSTAKYTDQPIERLNVHLTLECSADIKNIYSPTHAVNVQREKNHATVTYEARQTIPAADFRLFFDVEAGPLAARVLSYRPEAADDGFFLLLASPQIKSADKKPANKTIVFVVDRSGSMTGEKIEQARAAAKFVLNNLHAGDLFNIVAYDNTIQTFRPELQRYGDETRQAALAFIDDLRPGGSTDIDGALGTALAQLQDKQHPSYILFLTDGLPTAGETNEVRIVADAKRENQVHARMIVFGVGYDVNSRLLDKLARENFGQSEYVRPTEDIEDHVSRLYRKIEAPVMTEVQVAWAREGGETRGQSVNRVYPKDVFDLFAGEQLVMVGRYPHSGSAAVTITGRVGGELQTFQFPVELARSSRDQSQAFIEKLWATRRIGEIIDELDLKGHNSELVKELVELSTRHGILTPYTSFLADETTRLSAVRENATTAHDRLRALAANPAGESGFSQRLAKSSLQNAPQAPAPSGPGGIGGGVRYQDAAKDCEVVVTTVRNVGNKSFYQRGGCWLDSTVPEDKQQQAVRIKQFSPEYFELVARQDRSQAVYLAFDEPVVVNLDNQIYLIEP